MKKLLATTLGKFLMIFSVGATLCFTLPFVPAAYLPTSGMDTNSLLYSTITGYLGLRDGAKITNANAYGITLQGNLSVPGTNGGTLEFLKPDTTANYKIYWPSNAPTVGDTLHFIAPTNMAWSAPTRAEINAESVDNVIGQINTSGFNWLIFDGEASAYVNITNSASASTNNFTFYGKFLVPPTAPASNMAVFSSSPNVAGASSNSVYAYIGTDSQWHTCITGSTSNDVREFTNSLFGSSTFVARFAGKPVAWATGRSNGLIFAYFNETNNTLIAGPTSGTPPAIEVPIHFTNSMLGVGQSNQWLRSRYVGSFGLANIPWTHSEFTSNYQFGIPKTMRWGRIDPVYTSVFSAGVDNWTLVGGSTITGNTDGVGTPSTADTLQITSGGTQCCAQRLFSGIGIPALQRGQRFTVRWEQAKASTNVLATHAGLRMTLGGSTTAQQTFALTGDTWRVCEFSGSIDSQVDFDGIRIALVQSSGSVTTAAGETGWIKNVRIYIDGVVFDLDIAGANTLISTNIADNSTNTTFGYVVGRVNSGGARKKTTTQIVESKAVISGIRTVTAAYTVDPATDNFIWGNTVGGAFAVTLPSCTTTPLGYEVTISRNGAANALTLATVSNQLLDRTDRTGSPLTLTDVVPKTVKNNGTNWVSKGN